MVDFEKNGTKLSLMMFLTTFVPKKIGNVFANVDFHVNPHFAALWNGTLFNDNWNSEFLVKIWNFPSKIAKLRNSRSFL